MRILHISSLWPPSVLGGAELYAGRLAGEQAAQGHDVAAVTLGVEGEHVIAIVPPWPYRVDAFRAQPAWRKALFHARDLYDPLAARVVRRAIASFRPDVVHTHSVAGLSASVLTASPALGIPSVHTLHDHWLLCERTTLTAADGRRCDRRCLGCRAFSGSRRVLLQRRFADAVVAPSTYIAQIHGEAWPWLQARIVHVPQPADPPPSSWVRRERRRADLAAFGYLGLLTATKGIRTLITAFASLDPSETELVVAGAGELAHLLSGAASVHYLGWLDGDAREEFFASIDCLVVPSESPEAGALTMLEARQRGLPTIAAAIGALPEYVDPASRPLLFPSGDVGALVQALRSFAADPLHYETVGPKPPTWPEQVDEIAAVYERARAARQETR